MYHCFLVPAIVVFSCTCRKPYETTDKMIERKIDSLLSDMTLEEKIGQTAQRGESSLNNGNLSEEIKDAVRKGRVGSFLNVTNPDNVKELQRIAIEESRSGIPLIFARDVIHGYKTIFPIPLGLAATWNPGVVEKCARISAEEATTAGIKWTFAPMLDICRDPRWGRIAESPGEDPFLASAMAKAYIKGFQGDDLSSITSIAACAKHFAAYGAAEGGRDYNSVSISEQLLRDVYLKPFYTAQQAGAATFMASFNDVNGVPSSGNEFLLKQILRDEWGFDGFVVSDWESVTEMINHGFCSDTMDAARRAAMAGLDMEMTSTAYEKYLEMLIQDNIINEKQLDEFVRNILRIKFRLGLFEQPYTTRNPEKVLLTDDNLDVARQAAIQSIVLLKNQGNILPLDKSTGKIAVAGPLADAPHEQLGTWIYDGEANDSRTPLAALRNYLGQDRVVFEPGLEYSRQKSREGFNKSLAAAENADVILFFGGEEAILSGEAHSRADINLPGAQEELINRLSETNKPLVLIILAGRPITLSNIIDKTDAVIMAWHPGTMGGPAIADVLFGKSSPGGRLPVTWPVTAGQIPVYYNHNNTGRPPDEDTFIPIDSIPVGIWQTSLDNTSHYRDIGFKPQFPFGYGLTYTCFEYSNIRLSKAVIHTGEAFEISADIHNTGLREGSEIVQLYVRDLVGDIVRPVKELKGFTRIHLQPGEQQRVTFVLSADDLAFHNRKMELVTEPGQFKVWIGKNSDEGLEATFELKK
ncbi:MAG: glycoside hydrolase family 3 C-terminal domain-containing protein [Bacteroidales bacterium]|nr:glycoside hydrolase family 3 C-terminal domain-containing protein [Bacteroidales bacterium]